MLLNEIFQFLDCPLKLKYGKEHTPIYDFKFEVFDLFLDRCLLHKAKVNSITLGAAKKTFSECWHSVKTLDRYSASDRVSDRLVTISHRVQYIVDFLSTIGEMITVADVHSIQFEKTIIDSQIASVSRSPDGMFHFIFKYSGSQFFYKNEKLFIPTILKYISKSYLKELSDSKYCIHIYKPATGKITSFYEDIDMRKVKPIIEGLILSIKSSKAYPTNSIGTCMRCEFKTNCEWNVE